MNSSITYIAGFIIGLINGFYYFAGLWWTVQKTVTSSRPRLLLAVSFVARLLPTLAVIYFTARYDPGLFVTVLPGFFLMRFIMTKKITSYRKEAVNAAQS